MCTSSGNSWFEYERQKRSDEESTEKSTEETTEESDKEPEPEPAIDIASLVGTCKDVPTRQKNGERLGK